MPLQYALYMQYNCNKPAISSSGKCYYCLVSAAIVDDWGIVLVSALYDVSAAAYAWKTRLRV